MSAQAAESPAADAAVADASAITKDTLRGVPQPVPSSYDASEEHESGVTDASAPAKGAREATVAQRTADAAAQKAAEDAADHAACGNTRNGMATRARSISRDAERQGREKFMPVAPGATRSGWRPPSPRDPAAAIKSYRTTYRVAEPPKRASSSRTRARTRAVTPFIHQATGYACPVDRLRRDANMSHLLAPAAGPLPQPRSRVWPEARHSDYTDG